ncbi:histidine phosphatase family protein [Virgibacillus phasianinus]|uniref:Histidine phosphatase family protein n=1 Tax=Virgibacillus phasianinus TaxID=2017483 RepID=A0A220U8L4_9BACI|nr:histidine phosphatase family protein [Virgibacillus phasianinus]ASK64467.1 histidine phosphatase family protein [Virgibacillus phasianinus]
MTKIGFVRHGITPWNIEGRAQGNSDIPLNGQGLAEAQQLAARLRTEDWDVIYSSDLLRASQTAETIADKMGVQLHLDPRLREVGGGLIEGTTEEERIDKWGRNWRELDLGMETHANIIARGLPFIEKVHDKHKSQNILIVSHGSFIKHLLSELVPQFKIEDSLKNTSFTSLIECENGWDCNLYNCTRHLVES